MKLAIRGKYSDHAVVICKGFRLSNYMNELEIYFDDIPLDLATKELTKIGFSESCYSKCTWTCKTEDISSFTNMTI